MLKDAIKKISISVDDTFRLAEVTQAWRPFIAWLKTVDSEEDILKCLVYEMQNECRPAIIDRLRTRFNSLRVKRELLELEKETGKIISLNFRN